MCLFDKTGTITADQLTAVGVIETGKGNKDKDTNNLTPMTKTSVETALVLGGCHALISINGSISGDPIEEAVIKSIDFTYDPITFTSHPRTTTTKTPLVAAVFNTAAASATAPTAPTTTKSSVTPKVRPLPEREWKVKEDQVKIQTLHHFHFASKLQRMSVVAKVDDGQRARMMSLVKGVFLLEPHLIARFPRSYRNSSFTWPETILVF